MGPDRWNISLVMYALPRVGVANVKSLAHGGVSRKGEMWRVVAGVGQCCSKATVIH